MPLTAPDEPWQDRGRCAGLRGVMFPAAGDMAGVLAAKAVCEGCEVLDPCLTYALDSPERFGVWGGQSEYARRRLRKARKQVRKVAAVAPPRRRDPTRPPPRRTAPRRRSAA